MALEQVARCSRYKQVRVLLTISPGNDDDTDPTCGKAFTGCLADTADILLHSRAAVPTGRSALAIPADTDDASGKANHRCVLGLSSLSNAANTHYAYFDPGSVDSAMLALDQLDDYIAHEGPFGGVLAFSQGAGLAAACMVRRSLKNQPPPFECAIFFSCVSLYDPTAWYERGEVRPLDHTILGPAIADIPTVHVWGKQDERKGESEGISKLCDSQIATIYVHDGGHEVPGLGVKGDIPGTVRAMRRAITTAQSMG
ncbi:hypothetical protein MMC27_006602, partial [Xylographa pallens]|nr:hypothetical protein [Xylographa pallens]